MLLRLGRALRLPRLLALLTSLLLLLLLWRRTLTWLPHHAALGDLKSGDVHWPFDTPAVRRAAETDPSRSVANASVSEGYRRRQLEVALALLRRQAAQLERQGLPASFGGRPVPESAARRLLLLSTWRSGSSFVGQLLASQPLAFYVFEPVKWTAIGKQMAPPERRVQVLRDVLRCNFSAIAQPEALAFSVRSAAVDAVCARLPEGCRSRTLLEEICTLHPVRVVKTVRARVRYLEDLVRASPSLTLVLLVRDPRAVVHSRQRQSTWCRRKCGSVPLLCQWLTESLREAAELERQLPGRVVTARYEQLTLDVVGGTQSLFAALQVPLSARSLQFLLQHTGQQQQVAAELLGQQGRRLLLPQNASARMIGRQKHDPFSTYRNSSAAAQDWRRTMKYQLVKTVQLQCAEALPLLKYRTFQTQAELRNLTILLETVT